jgi:UrcA family protein
MHGGPPLFTLVPSPQRVSAQLAKAETHSTSEETVMNAKFHSSTRSISFRTALAAIACGIALTTPAVADSNGEPLTKIVSYAGLNLNGEPGARVLYGRLRMAAAQVCAPFKGDTLQEKTNWRECFDQALARSVAKVDEPLLTAYHLNRTGKTEAASRVAKDQ